MLLARKGYKVLVVDRATFPSDTDLDAPRPPARCGRPEPLGAPRPARGDGLPADRHVLLRLRPPQCSRARRGTDDVAGRVRPAPDRPRQAARGRRGRRGGRGARRLHRRRDPHRGRRVTGHPRSRTGRQVGDRARPVVIGADGRHSQVAEAVEPEQYNEKPPLWHAYYTYWSGLPMDGVRDLHPRPDRGWAAIADARRPDARRGRLAARGVRREQARRRRQLPQDVRAGARVRRARPRREARGRSSSAPACRTSSASRSAPAGRSSATRATTRIRSRRKGSWTRSATPSSCATALDESFTGARSFDDAMADYQRARDEHVDADVRVHDAARDAGAATAGDAAAVRRGLWQPGRDGRVRADERRRDLTRASSSARRTSVG